MIKTIYKVFCIAALCMPMWGCQWFGQRHQQAGAAVEINGNYLYQATLDSLTLGLSSEDSVRVAQQYIGQWSKDILMYEHAKAHADKQVEAQVEAYRRSLYVHAYEEYLVERRMPKTVPDSAVRQLYERMPDRFILDESLVKGAMVVVVSDAPNLQKLRKAMSELGNRRSDAMDDIEKYAYRNASGYELFTDRWLTVSDLLPLMPIERSELENRLKQSTLIETSDSTRTYLLQVTDKCLRGERMPLEYARPEIEQIILSDRRVEFLQKERERLYDEAVVTKKIQFYEN